MTRTRGSDLEEDLTGSGFGDRGFAQLGRLPPLRESSLY